MGSKGRECFGTRIPYSILVHNLLAIEIKIQVLKLTMQTSMLQKKWTRMECGFSIPIQTLTDIFLTVATSHLS